MIMIAFRFLDVDVGKVERLAVLRSSIALAASLPFSKARTTYVYGHFSFAATIDIDGTHVLRSYTIF